jgi:carboxyl-terminal processing protease
VATGKPSGDAKPQPLLLPKATRLPNGIGVIRLFGFMGTVDQGKLYTETAQRKISDLKAQGACRFVLDVREDTGGNMYPMLNGVSGLLEPGTLGTFLSPHGKYTSWVLEVERSWFSHLRTLCQSLDAPQPRSPWQYS